MIHSAAPPLDIRNVAAPHSPAGRESTAEADAPSAAAKQLAPRQHHRRPVFRPPAAETLPRQQPHFSHRWPFPSSSSLEPSRPSLTPCSRGDDVSHPSSSSSRASSPCSWWAATPHRDAQPLFLENLKEWPFCPLKRRAERDVEEAGGGGGSSGVFPELPSGKTFEEEEEGGAMRKVKRRRRASLLDDFESRCQVSGGGSGGAEGGAHHRRSFPRAA